jgi:hypothetical protein
MKFNRHSELFLFFLQWLLGTFLGFVVSLGFVEIGARSELGAIDAMIGGAIIGLVQTLALSSWFPQAWLWMLVNTIAWGLLGLSDFGAIGWYAPLTESFNVRLAYGAMFGAIAGMWLGIWQWWVLRKYLFEAWRWIIVNLASWSIGLSVGWAFGGMVRTATNLFFGEVIGLALTWCIVSVITGLAMTLFISQTLSYFRKFGKVSFF